MSENQDIIDLIESIGYGKKQFLMILLAFITIFAEGVNFTLSSVVVIPLEHYLNASKFENLCISGVLFIGVGVGSLSIGFLTKSFSRVTVFRFSLVLLTGCCFGIALIKDLIVFCIFRLFVGASIGITVPISLNILCEYLPTKNRSLTLVMVWLAFSFGSIFNLVLVYLIMPNYESDRMFEVFIGIAILVTIINLISLFIVQDSPRNLILENRIDEGIRIMQEMLDSRKVNINNIQRIRIIETIQSGSNSNSEHKFNSLFNDKYLFNTVNLMISMFIISCLFYGPLLIYSPTLHYMQILNDQNIILSNIISNIFGISVLIIAALLSEVKMIGLKYVALGSYSIGSLLAIGMILHMNRFEYYMIAYLSITSGGTNALQTIASISYPTKIRDFASGFLYFILRIGGFFSQFIFLGLFDIQLNLPYYVLIGLTLVIIINVMLIKYDPDLPLDCDVEDGTGACFEKDELKMI